MHNTVIITITQRVFLLGKLIVMHFNFPKLQEIYARFANFVQLPVGEIFINLTHIPIM